MGYEKERRPQIVRGLRHSKVTTSTAALADASTALAPNDVIALRSTSTNGPVVYTLSRLPKPGEHLNIHASLVGATSAGAGFHVNAYSGSFFGSSSQDMATMIGQGNGFSAIATSTIRWGVVGVNEATFSSST